MAAKSEVQVALLRGINVSGHNPLPMKDLRSLFEALGCEDVATYLQSGNVVFRTDIPDGDELAAEVTGRIREGFGHDVVVLVRTAAEVERVAESNPFLAEGVDPAGLHVTFLAAPADPERQAGVEAAAEAAGPDTLEFGVREVYLHCPNGYGRTKLNNTFFERKLALAATTRNWKTVMALREMARR